MDCVIYKIVMNNIDLFSEDLHPQKEMIDMLKNL